MQEVWKNSTFVENGTIPVVYTSYGGVLEICQVEFFLYWDRTFIKDRCHQNRTSDNQESKILRFPEANGIHPRVLKEARCKIIKY